MQKLNRTPLIEFFQLSQPLALLAGAMLYALGAGVLVYRGNILDWNTYWLGQAAVSLLQLSSVYLKIFYDRLQEIPRRGIQDPARPDGEVKVIPRVVFLLSAVTTLTSGAMVTVLLYSRAVLNPAALLILGLSFAFAFFYSVPPLRLVYSGYGELISAVFLTTFIPGFAYLLQSDEFVQVLGIMTFPLTALFLAMMLAVALESYYAEIKKGRQNMMIRLGWQRGMFMHNLLVLFAFLAIGVGPVFGLPWDLTWSRLLVLPVGLFQVWQIWQIGNGKPTRWKLLRLTAGATFGLVLYLQVFSLWVG